VVPAPLPARGRVGLVSANPLNGLRAGLGGVWARLRRSGRRGAPVAPGRPGPEGGRLYALWLWVLPLLLGLALGWLASVCIGIGLARSGGVKGPAPDAASEGSDETARQMKRMDGFLAANPFRISPMVTAPEPAARSADVVVTGSLATAVLRGTLPRAGAWLEDKGKLRLVLVGTSFDVYTLKWVTYREAVFVKGEERVVKQLLYGEPGLPSASAAHASDAAPVNVPVGSVVAAKPGEQEGQVPSGLVNDLVQNPFDELKKIRLRPMDGEAGLEIQWIQEDSILSQLGVRKGDVIKSVNGIPFTNMGDIANSINSLMNSERFDVEVTRDGKPTALRYVVH